MHQTQGSTLGVRFAAMAVAMAGVPVREVFVKRHAIFDQILSSQIL